MKLQLRLKFLFLLTGVIAMLVAANQDLERTGSLIKPDGQEVFCVGDANIDVLCCNEFIAAVDVFSKLGVECNVLDLPLESTLAS